MKKESTRVLEAVTKKHFGDLLEITHTQSVLIPLNVEFHVLGDPSTIAIKK